MSNVGPNLKHVYLKRCLQNSSYYFCCFIAVFYRSVIVGDSELLQTTKSISCRRLCHFQLYCLLGYSLATCIVIQCQNVCKDAVRYFCHNILNTLALLSRQNVDGVTDVNRTRSITEQQRPETRRVVFWPNHSKTETYNQTIVFTAQCTTVQSAVLLSHVICLSVCLSVCPSVTLVDHDHIG